MRLNRLSEGKLNVKTLSVEELAKHHGVSVKVIEDELKRGIEVEKEHTTSEEMAREIALDHLKERCDYYRVLKKSNL